MTPDHLMMKSQGSGNHNISSSLRAIRAVECAFDHAAPSKSATFRCPISIFARNSFRYIEREEKRTTLAVNKHRNFHSVIVFLPFSYIQRPGTKHVVAPSTARWRHRPRLDQLADVTARNGRTSRRVLKCGEAPSFNQICL